MSWSNLVDAPPPLSMPGLLAVSERWQPGATADFEPASAEQIAALAAPHGGVEVLPRIYRAFLETMGASTGALRLTWGSTAIADLLEDLLARLGFSYTELGASIHCVPLESAPRGAVALLLGPSSLLPHTRLRLRARDPLQLRQLQEIIADHQHAQEGT